MCSAVACELLCCAVMTNKVLCAHADTYAKILLTCIASIRRAISLQGAVRQLTFRQGNLHTGVLPCSEEDTGISRAPQGMCTP